MSLQFSAAFPALRERLTRRIRQLIRRRALPLAASDGSALQIVFAMDIQPLIKPRRAPVRKIKPEGIRIFLAEKMRILAAIDFHFSGQRLRFTSLHGEDHLGPLLRAINALERRYRKTLGTQQLVLLQFPPALHPLLAVRQGRQLEFFRFPRGKTHHVPAEAVENEILSWYKTRNKKQKPL